MPDITPTALQEEMKDQPPVLIDVRSPKEFKLGKIEDAILIPIEQLRNRLDEVPRDKPVVLYCRSGYRSYLALRILANRGWTDLRSLLGGYDLWLQVTGSC
jgi:rhodanese-related sulfurtransferase